MADLKKLAQGRKAFTRMEKGKPDAKPEKPAKPLEDACRDEIGEAEQAFRDRLDREDERKQLAIDSEFWFAVYFQSRAEKDAFLRKYSLAKIGDKYLAGAACDRVLQGRIGNKDAHTRRV